MADLPIFNNNNSLIPDDVLKRLQSIHQSTNATVINSEGVIKVAPPKVSETPTQHIQPPASTNSGSQDPSDALVDIESIINESYNLDIPDPASLIDYSSSNANPSPYPPRQLVKDTTTETQQQTPIPEVIEKVTSAPSVDISSIDITKPVINLESEEKQAAKEVTPEPVITSNSAKLYDKFKVKPDASKVIPIDDFAKFNEFESRVKNSNIIKTKFIAAISGYSGFISPLNLNEKLAFISNTEDPISRIEFLYKSVYSKITDLSISNISYEDWLTNTARADWETILYSLYQGSFPGVQNFDLRCTNPTCRTQNSIPVDDKSLISIRGNSEYLRDSYRLLEATSGTIHTSSEVMACFKNSKLKNPETFQLPDSRIQFAVKYESLKDYLRTEFEFSEYIKKNKNLDGTLLESHKLLQSLCDKISYFNIPSVRNPDSYFNVSSLSEKIEYLNYISSHYSNDFNILMSIVISELEMNSIQFKTPKFRCAKCGEVNDSHTIEFEFIIFLVVNKMLSPRE